MSGLRANGNAVLTALVHPRVRMLVEGESVSYEFIDAAHGEVDYRVASTEGYVSVSVTEEVARRLARCPGYFVESRIAGVTDWEAVSDRTAPRANSSHDPADRSCAWCALARWWSGLTRCEHCGWVWDRKTSRTSPLESFQPSHGGSTTPEEGR